MALHLTLRLLLVEAVPRGEGGSLMGSLGAALNQRLQRLPEAPRQGPEQKGASQVARWQRTHLPMQEMHHTWVRSLGQEDPLE